MNARTTLIARTGLAAALMTGTAGHALAQIGYNRTVRPNDISFSPVAGTVDGYSINLTPAAVNKSGADMDLRSKIVVTINDTPIASFRYIIFVWHTGGACVFDQDPANCGGDCIAASCRRDFEGDCACHSYYDLVVPGPIGLHPGDVVGLHIAAEEDASPELYTSDDSAYRVFTPTVPTCPADVNGSGTLSVQDIFDFLAAYFAGSMSADFNGSGAVTVQDIFDYLAAYFAGCP